jgi:hypothetical protein
LSGPSLAWACSLRPTLFSVSSLSPKTACCTFVLTNLMNNDSAAGQIGVFQQVAYPTCYITYEVCRLHVTDAAY